MFSPIVLVVGRNKVEHMYLVGTIDLQSHDVHALVDTFEGQFDVWEFVA